MIVEKYGITLEHDFEDILFTAQEFTQSGDILLWDWTRYKTAKMPLLYPAMMCYAFSCELYFKGISFKLYKSYEKTHSLVNLYNKLPEKIQDKIKKAVNDINFNNQLNSVDKLFEESRYFFDKQRYGDKIPNIEFIISLSNILAKIADEEITKNILN